MTNSNCETDIVGREKRNLRTRWGQVERKSWLWIGADVHKAKSDSDSYSDEILSAAFFAISASFSVCVERESEEGNNERWLLNFLRDGRSFGPNEFDPPAMHASASSKQTPPPPPLFLFLNKGKEAATPVADLSCG